MPFFGDSLLNIGEDQSENLDYGYDPVYLNLNNSQSSTENASQISNQNRSNISEDLDNYPSNDLVLPATGFMNQTLETDSREETVQLNVTDVSDLSINSLTLDEVTEEYRTDDENESGAKCKRQDTKKVEDDWKLYDLGISPKTARILIEGKQKCIKTGSFIIRYKDIEKSDYKSYVWAVISETELRKYSIASESDDLEVRGYIRTDKVIHWSHYDSYWFYCLFDEVVGVAEEYERVFVKYPLYDRLRTCADRMEQIFFHSILDFSTERNEAVGNRQFGFEMSSKDNSANQADNIPHIWQANLAQHYEEEQSFSFSIEKGKLMNCIANMEISKDYVSMNRAVDAILDLIFDPSRELKVVELDITKCPGGDIIGSVSETDIGANSRAASVCTDFSGSDKEVTPEFFCSLDHKNDD